MMRFLAANLPFFGWHVLFSRGVSKLASELDVRSLRARMCLEENSDDTSESLIAESQRHI